MHSLSALPAILILAVSLSAHGETTPAPAAAAPASVDADYDGVADAQDKCLGTALIKKVDTGQQYSSIFPADRRSGEPKSVPVDANGCDLDSDKDGVPDYLDFCPEDSAEALVAGVHVNGCPKQSDGDGTPDYRDKCPATPRGVNTDAAGCPK